MPTAFTDQWLLSFSSIFRGQCIRAQLPQLLPLLRNNLLEGILILEEQHWSIVGIFHDLHIKPHVIGSKGGCNSCPARLSLCVMYACWSLLDQQVLTFIIASPVKGAYLGLISRYH